MKKGDKMSACPKCGSQMKFVEQYGQWFCYSCGQYHQVQQPQKPGQQVVNNPQPQPGAQNPPQRAIGGDLEYETVHSPSFTALVFYLKQGQSVVAEKGAMMYMHRTIEIKTAGRKGGLLKGIMTSALGGESFFVNTFTASQGAGELALVGPTMGDIRPIDVTNQGMILQSGAYLASSPLINLDTKWQGLKGFLAEKDFIMLHASGPGNVWVSSFGGIVDMNLRAGETLSVDTGHLVAFPDNMQFSVRRVGGWKSTILSGEGLVSDLVGPGKILMQTRHLPAFVQALLPYLPQQR